jgi:hypothetical protein
MDLVCLVLTTVLFASAIGLIVLCDRLREEVKQ